MKIIVLGADGYLGWPTCMHLAAKGHEVIAVDNYLKRTLAQEHGDLELLGTAMLDQRVESWREQGRENIHFAIGDVRDYGFMSSMLAEEKPDAIVHYGEQPSGPFSMLGYTESALTLENNVGGTLSLIHAILDNCPEAHLVKLGTAGEFGTPNTDIPEGFFEYEYKGRKDTRLYPREAGSMYHTCKILETDLLWFYCRMKNLRVTDLMQGPVYGMLTPEVRETGLQTHFNYDDIFGTVINRFCVQALIGEGLTVYGKGGQTRGYLNLVDTLQCVELALGSAPEQGELRVMNQYTEELTVNEIAEIVIEGAKLADIDASAEHIENPRKEAEEHHYHMENTKFTELGLEPHLLTPEVVAEMLEQLKPRADKVRKERVLPRVKW